MELKLLNKERGDDRVRYETTINGEKVKFLDFFESEFRKERELSCLEFYISYVLENETKVGLSFIFDILESMSVGEIRYLPFEAEASKRIRDGWFNSKIDALCRAANRELTDELNYQKSKILVQLDQAIELHEKENALAGEAA
ncbi:hypothetical protein [Vibrio harveyi]|uniref:hypothetical protein n=1 Tax=Vibrio harveyi TaxID=669 RepID=UPI003CEBEAA4